MKKTIALLYGGISPEHEISILSTRSIYQAINPEKYDILLLGISKLGNGTIV